MTSPTSGQKNKTVGIQSEGKEVAAREKAGRQEWVASNISAENKGKAAGDRMHRRHEFLERPATQRGSNKSP
jgi:hypothetical protein